MTPKEKAIELVNKYDGLAHRDFHPQIGYDNDQGRENAISCAIILIDEILDLGYVPGETCSYNVYNFYTKVKVELKIFNNS